ncbi:MAG: acetylxylan esterase [Fimbriimonadaceae bacterium]|nr:acetylxylan esterase [Fimbriimonadaceae bacterium]
MAFLAILTLIGLQTQSLKSPLDFAKRELAIAAGARRGDIDLVVQPGKQREAYTIQAKNGKVRIIGTDQTGAMYGAFEFAERLRNEGEKAWATNATGSPYLAERGLNLFTTLPWDYQKNDTDYDPAALTDPNRWWFQNDDYWTTLLDLMAKSRLNWLDIHGMWDVSVTDAPNLYAYFVTSPSFPKVGVSDAIKKKNLDRLNKVITMAHQRGIKVSLMAYQASMRIPQNPNPPYPNDEATVYKYTKEVVEQMIRRAPGLDAIGFRIGESGKGESFFKCYGEAVKASGRDIPLITRSWITTKQNVLPLARASKDFTVEIKYNGEQWGAPYMVAGGRVANWYSYSFEDYLSDSGVRETDGGVRGKVDPNSAPRSPLPVPRALKMWPGNLAEHSERWPAQPYKIVWQVRANGTHRIFPFYNPDWVRRSIQCMKIGTATGYTIEGADAYYPKSPDYYLANPADKAFTWIHQRDEMYWKTWGRLGYDPTVKDKVFDAEAKRMLDSSELVDAWKRASTLVAKAFMGFSLGPDHRSHAPELEWSGDSNAFIQGQGFDSHAYMPINEMFANRLTGGLDSRMTLLQLADELLADVRQIPNLSSYASSSNLEAKEIANAVSLQTALGKYYAYRFRSAAQVAGTESGVYEHREGLSELPFAVAAQAFGLLATNPAYRPFTERLRMHTNTFRWADEEKKVQAESNRVNGMPLKIHDPAEQVVSPGGVAGKLTWQPDGKEIVCQLDVGPDSPLLRPKDFAIGGSRGGGEGLGERSRRESSVTERSDAGGTPAVLGSPLLRPKDFAIGGSRGGGEGLGERSRREFSLTERSDAGGTPAVLGSPLLRPKDFAIGGSRGGGEGLGERSRRESSLTEMSYAGTNHPAATNALTKDAQRAWLLIKPLPSSTYFHRVPMKRVGDCFEVRVRREPSGYAIAAEADFGDRIVRYPHARTEMPFLYVPSLSAPTPQIYNADEAMRYFDPKSIDPKNYGGMLIGTRAGGFFSRFDNATKRKLLDPVSRGMRLVILQQDFTRYRLDWLPTSLGIETGNWTTFDPDGQLGLEKVDTDAIMWQRFKPSNGWEVFGNGGLARMRVGDGEIWVCSARLMQRMHIPSAAKAFVRLMSLGGKSKPTILIDSNSEGADWSSSCHPDLMNSHDIPFLTLGEVIAKEQGMNSFKPVPGPVSAEDVLEGRGSQIANAFLRGQVVKASKRTRPTTLAAFEKERVRRKTELMKSLGLDPMPPKTPLNARETGRIQREGYHIEKIVFESRPRFFVTAHVYVPSAPGRHPVIVNVNGHWAHKKNEDRIQLRCMFQALQGYIAIAIDSPGHSFEGNSLIERRPEGEHNDWFLIQGGTNTTGYYVWDAIRALDYMATRNDADMEHIGITGASGGGLATLYAFAADDRYDAAVPVVYMASLELAPDNGCLCNHVPGTCQVGDRSDVIGIQAPKPVYIMGAQVDGEFPPDATLLTREKMAKEWSLFGKAADTKVQIFAGGHDYNQTMREASIGFFDKVLKGKGDGSPVKQPPLEAINSEDRQLLVLDPPAANERTMRDLSRDYLDRAPKDVSVEQALAVNGGIPKRTPLKYRESPVQESIALFPGSDIPAIPADLRTVTFESEPGLVTPGILYVPDDLVHTLIIVVSDAGKTGARGLPVPSGKGVANLHLDILGTGELKNIELRYPIYLGRSVAFTGGWQIVRAAEAMAKYAKRIEIVGHGPLSSQAVMWAGLMNPSFVKVTGMGCLKSWQEVFDRDVTPFAVQPRAHLLGSLASLRAKVKNGEWSP